MTQVATKRDHLVEYVQRSIDRGDYRPGQRLPSEAEFGRLFGYSRITVRAALLYLAYRGQVEARQGKGWYVRFGSADPHVRPVVLAVVCCAPKLTTGDGVPNPVDLPPAGMVPVDTSEEVGMTDDHTDDRPVYVKIADEIRREIVTGGHDRGSKLPSESALCEKYDTSRVTVRRALALLMSWGLIEAIQGKGTFVRRQPPVVRLGVERFSRAARAKGKGAFAAEAERLGLSWAQEDLELALVELPSMISEVLDERRAVVKRRLMWLDGEPVMLADSYVPESIATAMGYEQGATAPGGLYALLEQHGHEVVRFREEIQARVVSPEEAAALELPAGSAVAALVRVAFDQNGRAVEYFDSVCVGDKYRFAYDFAAPQD